MAKFDPNNRDSFASKIGVITAAAGSAVGLGNIWRFPYVAGENGGGAFLIIYLFFIVAIGIPVMLSEFTIGRSAQRNAFGSFKKLAPRTPWYLIGLMGVLTAFIILAFYSTVAGWTLEYIANSVTNKFAGKAPDQLHNMFDTFKAGTFKPLLWQVIFMAITASIVLAGVKKGIEKYTRILMPLLLVLIIAMSIRAITLPGAEEGLKFLFKPDFSKINMDIILSALGQAFFSLSIGMGTLITYGSYIRKKENLANAAVNVSLTDTIIAILAGLAIFPAVFAFNIEPSAGPGLVFITLPGIFEQMAGGYFFSMLFFILLAIAALTSSISVLEVVVAYLHEELNVSRKKATAIATLSITALGVLATLSWGAISEFQPFGFNLFGLLDFTASSILLPVGGLFIVLFVGWYLNRKSIKDEITNNGWVKAPLFNIFMIIVRYIAPVVITLILLNKIGVM